MSEPLAQAINPRRRPVMDIGMFAYWWTGVAGTFSAKTIAVTGIDRSFEIAEVIAAGALFLYDNRYRQIATSSR
jgi:hypothetical protein